MKDTWQLTTTRTIDLGYDQLLILEGKPGMRVKVLFGEIWLTQDGGGADHFPRAGDEVVLAGKGSIVIESLGAAWIEVVDSKRIRPLRRLFDALRLRWRVMRARREAFGT
jgi:hypothetical protein